MKKSEFSFPQSGDYIKLKKFADSINAIENDLSYANMFLLKNKHGIMINFMKNVLLRYFSEGVHAGSFSLSFDESALDEDIIHAMERIEAEAKICKQNLRLSMLTEYVKNRIEKIFPNKFSFEDDRDYAEYIYSKESLRTFKGKKLSAKRNHVNHFLNEYPDTHIVPITLRNMKIAEEIAMVWLKSHEDDENQSHVEEFHVIQNALANFEKLKLKGILLYADGIPVGMSIASEISKGIWDIHFEKVLPQYPHAWAVIVKFMAEYLEDAVQLNREEDIGIEGLRKSKLSYRPAFLNYKYTATLVKQPES